jgi:hypothetical protein
MQEDDQHEDFSSTKRRRRTLWIVAAHVLIGALFFIATFYWGNFE